MRLRGDFSLIEKVTLIIWTWVFSVGKGVVFGILMEFSLKLFISLLDVDAHTDSDEQKRTSDDQNDN